MTSTASPRGVNFSALSITASSALDSAIGSAQAVMARAVPGQPDALGLGERAPGGDPLGGQLADVGEPEVGLGVLGQRQVQQVVEDLGEALALGADGGDLLVALGQFEGEQLDAQQQRGERVAQLVRGVGDEGALLLQHFLDVVGHLVERTGQAPEFRRPAGRARPGSSAGRSRCRGWRRRGRVRACSTQPVSRSAAPTASSIAADSPAPMISSQPLQDARSQLSRWASR